MYQFSKISYQQFEKDTQKALNASIDAANIAEIYNKIKLPRRATSGSAGYDFFTPFELSLAPWTGVVVPTGIRVMLPPGHFLMMAPRSGLGFKHYVRLANTVGVIDEDYAMSDNEGHIFVKLRNESNNDLSTLIIEQGEAFVQGIIIPYIITKEDCVKEKRVGGLGSTSVISQSEIPENNRFKVNMQNYY